MKIHDLKTLMPYFEEVANGNKTFEIRKNDRDYEEGDVLLLREIMSPSRPAYTGRMKAAQVTYMTDFEQKEGYVVLGIALI